MMINPILERELKTRMRTWKTPILLFLYLGILGFVVGIAFLAEYSSYSYGTNGFDPTVVTGIYVAISSFQLGMLLFILPVFTATSISGEKERQTMDLLLCTDISPWSIIFGKMSAALSFVFLLIIAALPFTGVILLFGGVTLFDILKLILFFMATAVMVSSIGMFTTTHFKKNISSIVMSYIIFGATIVLPFVMIIIVTIFMNVSYSNSQSFLVFLETYAHELSLLVFSSNPFFGGLELMTYGSMNFDVFFNVGGGINTSSTIFSWVRPWMANVVYYSIVTFICLALSKRKLMKLK